MDFRPKSAGFRSEVVQRLVWSWGRDPPQFGRPGGWSLTITIYLGDEEQGAFLIFLTMDILVSCDIL